MLIKDFYYDANGNIVLVLLNGSTQTLSTAGALRGTNGNNIIISKGNNIILGMGGNDILTGTSGNDFIDGGTGHDAIVGGSGNDILDGGAGSDLVSGGFGNDDLVYRKADSLAGNLDLYSGDAGNDVLIIDLSDTPLPSNYTWAQYKTALTNYFNLEKGDGLVDFRHMSGAGKLQLVATFFESIIIRTGPIAVNDAVSGTEDTPLHIPISTLLANDNDLEGDAFSLVSVQGANPLHGSVAIVGNQVVFTPAPNFNGPTSFTYTIKDAAGSASTATVNVTIADVPELDAVNDEFTILEDGVSPNLLANDIFESLFGVGATIDGPNAFSVTGPNSIVIHPLPNFNGTITGSYTIFTGQFGQISDTANFIIHVTPVDEPIGFTQQTSVPSITENIDNNINLATFELQHPDGLASIVLERFDGVNWVPAGAGFQLINTINIFNPALSSNTVQLVAPVDFEDGSPLRLRVTVTDQDQDGPAEIFNLAPITIINDPEDPIAVDDDVTVERNSESNLIDVLANDTDDDGDTLTIVNVLQSANSTATIENNQISYTPDPGFFGQDTVTYQISDGTGHPPVFGTINITVIPEVDDPISLVQITGVPGGVPENDPGETLGTFALSIPDGLESFLVEKFEGGNWIADNRYEFLDQQNGTWVLKLLDNQSFNYEAEGGDIQLRLTVTDSIGDTTATAQLPLTQIGDSPESPVANDDNITIAEDSGPVLIDVLDNDTDDDGDPLTITNVQQIINGGTASIENNQISFMADPNFFGQVTFFYTVTDGDDFVLGIININVTPVDG